MADLKFPLHRDTSRKIIHVDMDAFYASVEERDHPELRGKPLVIARHPRDTKGRGVVTTANYEARKFGIHSAMSAKQAFELCPTANFVPGNHSYYQQVSTQIHAIFRRYTDTIEPVALDEAYLDVTQNKLAITSAIKIAQMIQNDIYNELHLTCSAGVSYNKFLAKLASDYHKPSGLTLVLPEEAETFLKQLPIEKFHGVGKKTVVRMHELSIFTGFDLYQQDELFLIREFGKMGYSLYRKVRGIHDSPVQSQRDRKSIGKESTYGVPLTSDSDVLSQLRMMAHQVAEVLEKKQLHGSIIVLKVRYSEYETVSKRVTVDKMLASGESIFFYAQELWEKVLGLEKGIRLLGVTVTGLLPKTFEPIELPLWEEEERV